MPADWIAAHGLVPKRIVPASTGAADQMSGACPFVEDAREAGIRIFTTTCDQARRTSEAAPDAFLMNVPHTVTPAAHRLYRDELARLSGWLVANGGTAPDGDTLVATLRAYEDARAALRAARGAMSGRAWARAAAEFQASGRPEFAPTNGSAPRRAVPIALVGGPLWGPHDAIYGIVEDNGGEVALDGTEAGERGLPGPYDRRRLADDPVGEMADAHFGAIPDAFRRPNDGLYRWLKAGFAERSVRGVLFVRCVWCDLWHAELARLKEWAEIPVVDVDLNGEKGELGRTETRIQALLDAIR